MPKLRVAAFRYSATEIGIEDLAIAAISTTVATTLTGLPFNGLDDITAALTRHANSAPAPGHSSCRQLPGNRA